MNGRKVYLQCSGTGSPTVILQSGFGNAGDVWSFAKAHPPAVFQGVEEFTRVCAYDRPGSTRLLSDDGALLAEPSPSRSDPVPMPRTGAQVVSEWHDLLTAAGVPGPYVLVGHSIGGLFSVLFEQTYSDEIVGLVTVDATPPPLRTLLSAQQWNEFFTEPLLHPVSSIDGYVMEAYDVSGLDDGDRCRAADA